MLLPPFLPPGHKGDVPDGYHVVKSPTYNLWIPWRSFLVDGDPKLGIDLVKKFTKIYLLADKDKPAPTLKYVDVSAKPFSIVIPADYTFWGLLNQVVQEEPPELLDQVWMGFYASIGIEHGKPFEPDDRMKRILTEAAAVGDATARSITFHWRQKDGYYYENSNWQLPFVGGYKFQSQPGILNLDGYSYYYFLATGVTPAMEEKMVGRGSQYAWTARDANGNPLDGGKNYKLHLPKSIPVKNFWSVILYSDQTRSMIQTDQRFPSVSSHERGEKGMCGSYFLPRRLGHRLVCGRSRSKPHKPHSESPLPVQKSCRPCENPAVEDSGG